MKQNKYCFMLLKTLLCVYAYILTIYVYGANGIVHYRITSYHTCLSSNTTLNVINGISVKQCVEECAILSNCSAINYKRLYKLCELHSILHDNGMVQSSQPCIHVNKSDIHYEATSANDCETCTEGETCAGNQCGSKFCAALEIKDGAFRGNMKAVGSRVEITCRKYFKEMSGKTHSVCQSNGSWSHYPNCIPSFVYVGCYEDQVERILYEGNMSTSLSMTTDLCVRECFRSNFIYALTQYSTECFCGNTPRNYHIRPEDECNMPCSGNPNEICGGGFRGSLYKFNDPHLNI